MTLNLGCWHNILEEECGSPNSIEVVIMNSVLSTNLYMSNNKDVAENYNVNCSRCDDSMKAMIYPISRHDIMPF